MKRLFIVIIFALILLVVLSFVAQEVGGISLHSAGGISSAPRLELSVPVVPGVPTTLHIETANSISLPSAQVEWRTAEKTVFLGTVTSTDSRIVVTIPCDTTSQGSVVLRSLENNAVLAQEAASVLAAGADCAL